MMILQTIQNKGLEIKSSWLYWRVLRHLKQVLIIAGAYFLYMFVRRYLIADIETVAIENAIKVTSFEFARGFFWEPNWQSWVLEHSKGLAIFFNWAYILTFWPIIVITALIVYVIDREKYFHYRNLILLSLVISLIVFMLFPLAPPRAMSEHGFIDTIQHLGPSWYGSREMSVYYNAYAAMPSLHFSWTVLFGILFLRMKHLWLKPLSLIYPGTTFLAIVITGNHYIVDAIGGAAVTVASLIAYYAIVRLEPQRTILLATTKSHLARAATYLNSALISWKLHVRASFAAKRSRLRLEYYAFRRRGKGLHLKYHL
jgi:hypothetical protein